MSYQKSHDLYDFIRQISAEMCAEYNRIQMRATEDPGTAGDQGEENWAELLREWLPRSFEVVTKGRIISQEGETSPQIDVLVLKQKGCMFVIAPSCTFFSNRRLRQGHTELNPKATGAYIIRGGAYFEKGDKDRVIAEFSEVIRLQPDYIPAYQIRAKAYEKIGDKMKAQADWDKAAELEKQKAKP
jgi:tetratricopeptide (TPR) repeat protein